MSPKLIDKLTPEQEALIVDLLDPGERAAILLAQELQANLLEFRLN